MPNIRFAKTTETLNHHIPKGVTVNVASETSRFDITFSIGNCPTCHLVSNGHQVCSVTFLRVKALTVGNWVEHVFPLELGGPPGSTETTLTAVVTNTSGNGNGDCEADIINP